jgi:MFS transporter, DHA1 family, inner membrane transport protein
MSRIETAECQTSRQNRTERIVLLVLATVQFTSIVDFMVVMPLGPQLMRSLGIGPSQFGLIVSSYTFAAGAAGLVASSIVDRFSRRAAFLTLYAGCCLLVRRLKNSTAAENALIVVKCIVADKSQP